MQENVLALFPGPTAGSLLAHTIKELRNNLVSPSSNIGTLQFFFRTMAGPLPTNHIFFCCSFSVRLGELEIEPNSKSNSNGYLETLNKMHHSLRLSSDGVSDHNAVCDASFSTVKNYQNYLAPRSATLRIVRILL